MPSKSGSARSRSTWFQPMCGRVGDVLEHDGPSGDDPERRRSVLVAPVEEQLEAEADPEERAIVRDPGADRVGQALRLEPAHGGRRGPDAGHDERVETAQHVGLADGDDLGTHRRQCLVDADQVACPVVDDPDPRTCRHSRIPLVDATPVRRGSISQATRRARPSALKAASARW